MYLVGLKKLLICGMIGLAGCAGASVTQQAQQAAASNDHPTKVAVYPFAVDPDEVSLNSGFIQRAYRSVTATNEDEKQAEKSLQLSLYALAARDVLELAPERLVFYNLTTNEPITTSRDERSLKQAEDKVAEVAESIRAGDFPPRPGFVCRYCDFRPLCPAHEHLVSIRLPGK